MTFPSISRERLPAITADQMRQIDLVVTRDFGVSLQQMMENAGRSLAEVAIELFRPSTVVVMAGTGGNGGGGLAAARHLTNRGIPAAVVLSVPEKMDPVPRAQLEALRAMGVKIATEPEKADLVIDALFGYSLRGNPRGRAAELIEWAGSSGRPILSLDNPSGLDVTTGQAHRPCLSAQATLTLALLKKGLLEAPEAGDLYLADISVPSAAYRGLGLAVPALFERGPILSIE